MNCTLYIKSYIKQRRLGQENKNYCIKLKETALKEQKRVRRNDKTKTISEKESKTCDKSRVVSK